jgi:hypothetical protein
MVPKKSVESVLSSQSCRFWSCGDTSWGGGGGGVALANLIHKNSKGSLLVLLDQNFIFDPNLCCSPLRTSNTVVCAASKERTHTGENTFFSPTLIQKRKGIQNSRPIR